MQDKPRKNPALILLTNHLDAWGLTFVIITLFFVVHDAATLKNIALMLAITSMYWLGFAVNDFYDVPFDKLDTAKAGRNAFLLDDKLRSHFTLVMISVSGLAFVGFAQFGLRGISIFVFSLLILWGYSAPPIRLKSRPIFDLLTHLFFVETYPYVLCLILITRQVTLTDGFVLAFFGLASIGAQLEQQIRDYEIDAQMEQTFTTTFGVSLSSWMLKVTSAGLFAIGTIGLITRILPLWMLPFLAIGTPAVLHRFIRPIDAPRPEKLIRWTALATMTYAVLLWIFML